MRAPRRPPSADRAEMQLRALLFAAALGAAAGVSRRAALSRGAGAIAIATGAKGAAAQQALDPSRTGLGPRAYISEEKAARPLNILLTGGSSGIGRDAAVKLVHQGHVVTLACRTKDQAERVCREVLEEAEAFVPGKGVGTAIPMACDLGSLESVRALAAEWSAAGPHRGRTGDGPLDVLALNAGVALDTKLPAAPRTADGFELTVGVNHLGHFLLANLLIPGLRCGGSGDQQKAAPPATRLVVTASQVHDPATPGGNVGPGASLGAMDGLAGGPLFDMCDGGPFDGDKAYKDSKLCNVLFMEEAAKRLGGGAGGSCVAFSPGLITRTGLFRNQNAFFTGAFDFVAYNLARVAETVDFGGDCLVAACVGTSLGAEANGQFWSNSKPGKHNFEPVQVSTEAREEGKAQRLWQLSEKLVGLPLSDSCATKA